MSDFIDDLKNQWLTTESQPAKKFMKEAIETSNSEQRVLTKKTFQFSASLLLVYASSVPILTKTSLLQLTTYTGLILLLFTFSFMLLGQLVSLQLKRTRSSDQTSEYLSNSILKLKMRRTLTVQLLPVYLILLLSSLLLCYIQWLSSLSLLLAICFSLITVGFFIAVFVATKSKRHAELRTINATIAKLTKVKKWLQE